MSAPLGNGHSFTLQVGSATGVGATAATAAGAWYLAWFLWVFTALFATYVAYQMVLRTKHRRTHRRLQVAHVARHNTPRE